MSVFRVQYQGYIEGEFDDEESAVETFIENLQDDPHTHIVVDVWNEETGEWDAA